MGHLFQLNMLAICDDDVISVSKGTCINVEISRFLPNHTTPFESEICHRYLFSSLNNI